eukprot:1195725-Prorocentrum_minimum.AAC.4
MAAGDDPTAALLGKENVDVAPVPASLATYGTVAEQEEKDLAAKANFKDPESAVSSKKGEDAPQHEYDEVSLLFCTKLPAHVHGTTYIVPIWSDPITCKQGRASSDTRKSCSFACQEVKKSKPCLSSPQGPSSHPLSEVTGLPGESRATRVERGKIRPRGCNLSSRTDPPACVVSQLPFANVFFCCVLPDEEMDDGESKSLIKCLNASSVAHMDSTATCRLPGRKETLQARWSYPSLDVRIFFSSQV